MKNLITLFFMFALSISMFGQTDFYPTYLWDNDVDRTDVALIHLPEVNEHDGQTFNYIGNSMILSKAGQVDHFKGSFYIMLPYQKTVGLVSYNLNNKYSDTAPISKHKTNGRLFGGVDYTIDCDNFQLLLLVRKGTIRKLQIEYQDETIITIPTVTK